MKWPAIEMLFTFIVAVNLFLGALYTFLFCIEAIFVHKKKIPIFLAISLCKTKHH